MGTKTPHWLDNIVAVPTIGLRSPKNWRLAFRYQELVVPLLEKWDARGLGFVVKQTPPAGAIIELSSGTTVKLLVDGFVAEFKYALELETDTAVQKKAPAPRPYTEILADVTSTFVEVIEVLGSRVELHPDRIGVVAGMQMDRAHIPPGLTQLLSDYAMPWKGQVRKIDTNVLVSTSPEGGDDQCHHRLLLDNTAPSAPLTFAMDWQRLYRDAPQVSTTELLARVTSCTQAALHYFQKVGEGGF